MAFLKINCKNISYYFNLYQVKFKYHLILEKEKYIYKESNYERSLLKSKLFI